MYAARGAAKPLAPHFYPLSALRPKEEARLIFTVIARERSDRGNLPGGWVSAKYIIFTLVVGYFAYAQYDVCFFACLCEEAKRRSKLPGGWVSAKYIHFTLVVGYFACAQYDVRSPIGTSCHFPRRRKRNYTSF